MQIKDGDVAQLASLLSAERLGPLVSLTGNEKAAIELHQETLRVGADLMNITATIEIALRNTICENLSQYFGVSDWLLAPPAPFRWRDRDADKIQQALDSAQRAEYSKLSQAGKHSLDPLAFPQGRPPGLSHLRRAKNRRAKITVTVGKVIAEITLYTWKRMYGPDYEHTLWRPTLKRTFPDKKIKRAEVANHLESLYQVRNRLAHHEPVLAKRFSDMMTSVRFLSERLCMPSPTPTSPLANLLADDIEGVEQKAKALEERLASFRI